MPHDTAPPPSALSVSVALCTRNGARYLEPQLESLAAQSRRPDELVVCDDASTDETVAMVEAFARRAPFAVRVERNATPLGVTGNFSRSFSLCKGQVIFPCDQDDVWHPDKLAVMGEAFTREPKLAYVFCDLLLVDEAGRPTGSTMWQSLGFGPRLQERFANGHPWDVLLGFNVVTGAAMAFAASLLDWVLPIPPLWIHDEWIATVGAVMGGVQVVSRPLVHYRQHIEQQIGARPLSLRERYRRVRERLKMTYFLDQVQRTEAALTRIAALTPPVPDEMQARLHERIAHMTQRLEVYQGKRSRIATVGRGLVAGRYQRYGRGWQGAIADLLLAPRAR